MLMLSLVLLYCSAYCRYGDCRYAECRGANIAAYEYITIIKIKVGLPYCHRSYQIWLL